jgi:hypothetical protein
VVNSTSVGDVGCLSWIPNPKTETKEKGEKKLLSYLFCSHKYDKVQNYFIFEQAKKKLWANLQRIIEPFNQKIVIKLRKYGPGIRGKTYSGSRNQKRTGSRIQNTEQHRG